MACNFSRFTRRVHGCFIHLEILTKAIVSVTILYRSLCCQLSSQMMYTNSASNLKAPDAVLELCDPSET